MAWCVEVVDTPNSGSRRKTGRVALEVRSTHFQSSLINERCLADNGTSSMVLKSVARLTFSKLRMPGWTRMLSLIAGTKLARVTWRE